MRKLRLAIAGRAEGKAPLCGIAAAAVQTLAHNGMQDSFPAIRPFPAALVAEVPGPLGRRLVVAGLDEALRTSFEAGRLPSEMGFDWAGQGDLVDLSGYDAFPSR
jgi:hypothetical protein